MSQHIFRSVIFTAALVYGAGVQAATPTSTNDWQYALALYGWFPTVGGSLKYPLPSGAVADVEAGPRHPTRPNPTPGQRAAGGGHSRAPDRDRPSGDARASELLS